MTQPKGERREPLTWELWLFDAIPLSPPWVASILGLALYGLFLAYTLLFGSEFAALPGVAIENVWAAELLLASLSAIVPAITVYTRRGAVRDLNDLRAILGSSDKEYSELHRRITAIRPGVLAIVGLGIGLLGSIQIVNEPSVWKEGVRPPLGDPTLIWIALRNGLNTYMIARGVYIELSLAHAFSSLGTRIASLNLLDRAPLAPFGRRGLRSVLLWMLYTLFYSSLYAGSWAADVLPLVLISFVAFAFTAILLPEVGAHRRIQQARDAELARVREAIRTTSDALLVSSPVDMPGGRLADLVAYEGRISAVRAWPFDTPTLLRFGLYLGIGLGSWFGAALVERLLDRTLG